MARSPRGAVQSQSILGPVQTIFSHWLSGSVAALAPHVEVSGLPGQPRRVPPSRERARHCNAQHPCALASLCPKPAMLPPKSGGFAAGIGRIAARGNSEIRGNIQKPSELTKIQPSYTCGASVITFAPEIGGFCGRIRRFRGRIRRPDRRLGEKPRRPKGLRQCTLLSPDATEV